jgi:hypothetical protein
MRRRHLERPDLHPAELRRAVRHRDVAYAGFLYFGVALAVAFALNWMPTDWLLYRFLSRWFGFPVLAVSVPAGLLALGFSVAVWREWMLWIPAAFVLATPALLWRLSSGAGAVAWLGVYFIAFTLFSLGLPLFWFFVERRCLLNHPQR